MHQNNITSRHLLSAPELFGSESVLSPKTKVELAVCLATPMESAEADGHEGLQHLQDLGKGAHTSNASNSSSSNNNNDGQNTAGSAERLGSWLRSMRRRGGRTQEVRYMRQSQPGDGSGPAADVAGSYEDNWGGEPDADDELNLEAWFAQQYGHHNNTWDLGESLPAPQAAITTAYVDEWGGSLVAVA